MHLCGSQVFETLNNTHTLRTLSCSEPLLNPASYCAGSNMGPCLLLLAFPLANLGDSYFSAWETAEQLGEHVRRGRPEVQPMHTVLALIIFMSFFG